LEMLLDRRVEGLIVLANWLFLDINVLADLEKNSIPTVMIGRELQTQSISSVIVDNEAGAHSAIEHLYALGHRKIAFIRGPKMLGDSGSRWKGLRGFAKSAGMHIDDNLVTDLPEVREPNAGFEGGAKATEEFLRRKRSFSAIVAFDDMTALGCIRALAKAGIKVPEQCSIIGFDDVAQAAFSTPALTTIRQPMEAMGATAVEIVVDAIRGAVERRDGSPVTHRKVAPELVVRESTRHL